MKLHKFVSIIALCMVIYQNAFAQSILWNQKGNSNAALAVYAVTFSGDGQKVLSGSECHPANIRRFNATTGNLEWTYNVGTDFMCIQGVGFSEDASMIASVEELGNILIFNNSGAQPTIADTIKTGTAYAFAADFSPANDRIAVGASSGKMNIYELPGGALIKSVTAHPNFVFSVAYSPDGTLIGSGGTDNKAKIWAADGTLKFTLTGHNHDVTSVKFTPDNARLITAGNDGKIKIWNTQDGSLVMTINAHNDEIRQIDLSADGKKIVSASNDETCKIWSLETGELLATFGNANGGIVWSAAWAPDGNSIVTGTGKGDVILWDVSGVSAIRESLEWLNKVLIYPNPTPDQLYLEFNTDIVPVSLELFNEYGQLLRQLNPEEYKISIADLPCGLLQLRIRTDDGQTGTIPVIKQ